MILNLGSLSFNADLAAGGGTPAWGTEMGQGEGYKFTFEDMDVFFTSLVYSKIPDIENVFCPLGKGGNQAADYEFVIASRYSKIFVNGLPVPNSTFILLIVKKIVGSNHVGRRTLKYNPRMLYNGQAFNEECYDNIRKVLGLTQDAAWFIHEIKTKNQDELHFTAFVLDANSSQIYNSTEERKGAYLSKIKGHSSYEIVLHSFMSNLPLQRIFYGAPGTGKSNTIKREVEDKGRIHFRTTFHPDSDYSSFVGCYKPTKEGKGDKSRSLLDKDELVAKLKEYRTLYDETMAQTQFGYDYYEELSRSTDLADIIKEAGVKTFDTAVRIGMSLAERTTPKTKQSSITYSFVPQAFTKAYCEAWNRYDGTEESEPVFLIIEEINRGNCAQIFGDIFQLLDRKDGFSEYPIDADEDLKKFLQTATKEDGTPWLTNKDGIKDGKLCLPPNLHIWATMNTSDQSLFPIDSAFKRRWDWKYIPIDYNKETWSIVAKDASYSWSDFLKKMNNLVASATDSEDKMLGFYFAKAKNGIIDADTFVGKVVFYLWNDVFKDYGLPKEILNGAESKEFAFRNFFMVDGHANEDMVKRLLDNLEVTKDSGIPTEENVSTEDIENNTVGGKRDTSRYKINGSGNYPKTDLATEVMKVYVTNHPEMPVNDIISEWTSLNVAITDIVTDEATHNSKKLKTSDPRFDNRTGKVIVGNEALFVTRCWAIENVSEFIEKVNARSWDIHIENA